MSLGFAAKTSRFILVFLRCEFKNLFLELNLVFHDIKRLFDFRIKQLGIRQLLFFVRHTFFVSLYFIPLDSNIQVLYERTLFYEKL